MNMKVWRLLGYVCTFAFAYMTIEIVRADPERRLLVLWLLAGAGVVVICAVIAHGVREEERQQEYRQRHQQEYQQRHQHDAPGVVSLIERLRDK